MEGTRFSTGILSLAATIAVNHLDDYMSSWSTAASSSPQSKQHKQNRPSKSRKITTRRKRRKKNRVHGYHVYLTVITQGQYAHKILSGVKNGTTFSK
jgi:hypothetical protein